MTSRRRALSVAAAALATAAIAATVASSGLAPGRLALVLLLSVAVYVAGIFLAFSLSRSHVYVGSVSNASPLRVHLALARHLGLARDVPSVVTGVLETCAELFPGATHGAVFLVDEADGLLKSCGPILGPGGIETTAHALELAPDEGLPGAAFAAGGPMLWRTADAITAVEASIKQRHRVRVQVGQTLRSALAAPLRDSSDDTISGCLLIASSRGERAWNAVHRRLMEALAQETARAIGLARGHEADVDQALKDSITGLVSHRQMVNIMEKEIARAQRAETTVAVIFSDLDAFKGINDAWGHDAGNRVLAMYADVLRATLRREDTAARYGGDEFVCVLPGADREQALSVAARVQQAFADAAHNDPVVATSGASVSCGIAVFPEDAQDGAHLLTAADGQLISAKHERHRALAGRPNRPLVHVVDEADAG